MRRPDIDLPSAVQAIQVFLGQISKNLPVEIVAEYSRVSFVALIANYPQFEEAVHRSLYEVLSKLYGRGGRKLPTKIRSQFGSVLSRPMNQNTE